jgi:hypothetical protein
MDIIMQKKCLAPIRGFNSLNYYNVNWLSYMQNNSFFTPYKTSYPFHDGL